MASISKMTSQQVSTLFKAIAEEDIETLKQLENDAADFDINRVTTFAHPVDITHITSLNEYFTHTPLHFAAIAGKVNSLEWLLDGRASVDVVAPDGTHVWHCAALNEEQNPETLPRIFELILAKERDVNVQDEEGLSPLHYAAMNGYKLSAELLLMRGAEADRKDNQEKVPADYAENYPEIIELLIQKANS